MWRADRESRVSVVADEGAGVEDGVASEMPKQIRGK